MTPNTAPDEAYYGPREDAWEGAHKAVDVALEITQHDRNDKCGAPEDNFANIGLVWTGLLRARGLIAQDASLTAPDVARMMGGMKLVRDSNRPHFDNRVDSIGYTVCLERVEPTTVVEHDHVDVAARILAYRDSEAADVDELLSKA